jgi:predicted N-acetyltransferase YhbS
MNDQPTMRPACEADRAAILALHRVAFGPEEGPVIADLVAALLDDPTAEPRLSLLAERAGRPVGHILFTRATLSPDRGGLSLHLLAPLAVDPEAQGAGLGGALIRHGLARLRQDHADLVFVLGHPGYYPRHGFRPCRGIAAPYPIPAEHAEAWMVQELTPGALDRAGRAVLHCAEMLDQRRYWVA